MGCSFPLQDSPALLYPSSTWCGTLSFPSSAVPTHLEPARIQTHVLRFGSAPIPIPMPPNSQPSRDQSTLPSRAAAGDSPSLSPPRSQPEIRLSQHSHLSRDEKAQLLSPEPAPGSGTEWPRARSAGIIQEPDLFGLLLP